jgi:hypothetical protein
LQSGHAWIAGYTKTGPSTWQVILKLRAEYLRGVVIPGYSLAADPADPFNSAKPLIDYPFDNTVNTVSFPADNTYYSIGVFTSDGPTVNFDLKYDVPSEDLYFKQTTGYRYLIYNTLTSTNYNAIDGKLGREIQFKINPVTNDLVDQQGSSALSNMQIFVRFSVSNPLKAVDALRVCCVASGLTAASTFTSANVSVDPSISICVPDLNQNEYPSYLQVAQKLCKSIFGFLYINESREVDLKLFETIQSAVPDHTRTINETLVDETSVRLNYQDIVTTVNFENSQIRDLNAVGGSSPTSLTSRVYEDMIQLHAVNNTMTYDHCSLDIDTAADRIGQYLSRPLVEYTISTGSLDLQTSLGDVVQLNNPVAPDDSQTIKALVVGIETSVSKTKLTLNELRGV